MKVNISAGKFDIMSGILEDYDIEMDEKTIMDRNDLTLLQFSRYKEFLASKGLLRALTLEGRLEVTEKGRKFLKDYREIQSKLSERATQRQSVDPPLSRTNPDCPH